MSKKIKTVQEKHVFLTEFSLKLLVNSKNTIYQTCLATDEAKIC